MIMERPLPKFLIRIKFMKPFAYHHLILSNNSCQIRNLILLQILNYQDRMNMIGHNHTFIHNYIRIMSCNLHQILLCFLTHIIQNHGISKPAFSVMGTNRYKVVIMRSIIKFRKSCTFSRMKKDAFISFLIHKRKIVGGALPRPYNFIL